ncbi:MAG TPA: aldehyde dehydrogenase family protein [Thermoplasmata archaeon]|nr:aldehyde dehydrogenase family protein [Thermoplasmata archaeon]
MAKAAKPFAKRMFRMYINGKWVESESRDTFNVVSPASGEVIGTFPKGTAEDAKAAVEAAVEAQDAVRNMPIRERARLGTRIAEEIGRYVKEYAVDCSLEHGKPLRESIAEVEDSIPNVLWQVEDLKRWDAPAQEGYSKDNVLYMSMHEPLGTVATITPWNFPWVLPSEFVVQAMLAGNSVVFKPASNTPISAVHLMECIDRAGVPPGFINMVTGPGDSVGTTLVEHPLVDAIGFTGETATGLDIAKRAGLKKLTLELGGLGPLIIMDDAKIGPAVEDIAFGCFTTTGHCCVANERIFVHEKIHAQVVKTLVERVRKMKVGFPLDSDTDMGPINNRATLRKVETHVQDAVKRGAKVVAGGKRVPGMPTDLYYYPTVVDDVPPNALFNKAETFGPTAPIFEFSDLDDAIDMANAPRYGLSMAIHTSNLRVAMEAAKRLKSGQICINEPVYSWDYFNAWGGFRNSGLGRIAGRWSLDAFSELKTVMINVGRSPWPEGSSK